MEGGLRPRGGRILVALSGGPDSRVLLDALAALAPRLSLSLSACVVDHGLRQGSAREAQGALELARRLGVRGEVVRVSLPDKSARTARDARYVALARVAVACRAEAIALGHTASDQAETLIDHLLRGAGSRGLGAMAPRRSLGVLPSAGVRTDRLLLIRPLLEISRAEVEACVEAEGLAVVRDPTNDDLRFRRNRIRAKVLPLLRQERPDLDRALVRLCERLRLDAEYLDAEAVRAAARIVERPGVAGPTVDLVGLSSLHPALGARVLRALCEEAGVPGDRIPLDALLRLSRGRHGSSQIDLVGGIVAERRYARLRVGPPDRPPPPSEEGREVPVEAAGTVAIGRVQLRVPVELLAGGPLVMRRPRRGDRIRGRRLSDLLVDAKVARPDRSHLWALAPRAQSQGPADLRWVALFRGEKPGEIAWEWPSSGARPTLAGPSKGRSRHSSRDKVS
jgi:tRNA(Ile)-lysidine synthase